MKKLINRPGSVVEEMVEGLAAVHPGLARLPGHTVLVRDDMLAMTPANRKVALISGGGSGHEPAHAGYVGQGMLSAAVLGDVFTSPTPDAVLAAIRAVTGPAGALLIVKNYTGDRLNFGLAAELAKAEGYLVEMVVVADDVALAGSPHGSGLAGRRGLAGTVLIHKVAGAAAESGADLPTVLAEARAAAASVGTMGVALSPCIVPAVGKPGFSLGEGEIELGLGIHGEPGVRKGPLEPADLLTDRLLGAILEDGKLKAGDRVALLVNNLGGTTTMELAIVARRAIADLETRSLVLERVYSGTFLSALEMAGASLSVLVLDDTRLQRLDAPTSAPAWPNPSAVARTRTKVSLPYEEPEAERTGEYPVVVGLPRTALGQQFEVALMAATQAIASASNKLTDLDRAVGDGDIGISLSRGAQALRSALGSFPPDEPSAALHAVGRTLQSALGGTSGPLYAVFFLRGSVRLKGKAPNDPLAWADAFQAGCAGITELGGAVPGDRTMLDALAPAAAAFSAALAAGRPWPEALTSAAEAAERGAAATSTMTPRRGRSSYLGQRVIGIPDPGAEAVAIWLQALARALRPGNM
jgi:dihydroxyacetone kinase